MKKYNKEDYINILIIMISFLFFLILILKDNSIYGSLLDYTSQHYMIPEYFRTLFYNTKDLLPDFAFNLGMGQNIYYFSYYGLLSPIILLSYLLPHIGMAYYIAIAQILIIIISIALFYKWISTHFENKKIRFILTFMFMTTAPLIMHTHRHIMFIDYMPFLLLALLGAQKYVYQNKKILLIISSFLIILTNYFFSISALLVIFIYIIFLYLKKEQKITKKAFLKFILKEIGIFIIPVLMAMPLLLPTLYTILNSRFNIESDINILSYFIPNLSFSNILYGSYTLGFTAILVIAIANALISKEKHIKLIGILFTLITFFPIINYILNGFMYLNAKVYIPFIPLAFILVGTMLNNLKEINKKKLIIVTLILIILGIIKFSKYKLLILDILFTSIILILIIKTKKEYLLLVLLIPWIINCYIENKDDSLAPLDLMINQYDRDINEIINKNDSNNIYRYIDSTNEFYNSNNIRNIKESKTTMYSSLTNKYFKNFYWNEFNNENPYRNDAIFTDINNPLFNIYSGNRYYISDKTIDLLGFTKIDEKNSIKLYENEDTFTLGYTTDKLMSLKDYEKLQYPYNIEALMNYIIVDKDVKSSYKTKIKEIKVDKTSYDFTLKNDKKFTLNTTNKYKNKLLIIRFDMDYTESCNIADTYITINDVSNKLTCKGWKYHNKNYSFEYIISNKEIEDLNIEIGKGHYKINNLKVYTLDYNDIKNIKTNHSEFVINRQKQDILEGSIDVKNDGYFTLQIPYDKGFNIYVDNKKKDYELVDTAFIGFDIEKGQHDIKIEFKAPLKKEGIILSIFGLLSFIVVIYKGVNKNEKNINDSTLL